MTPSKHRYRKIKTRWLPCGKRVVYYQCRITGRTFALPLTVNLSTHGRLTRGG